MGGDEAPKAPKSPVSTADIKGTWDQANQNIGQVANNQLPMQAYNFFAPQLMSATPYGYDPAQLVQSGQNLSSQGQGLFDWGNMALQEGFDPQDMAYGRTADRLRNQMRASQGARGGAVLMSPHGAALENQGMSDFNLDWRMGELQRQQMGAQTAASLFGQGTNMVGQGAQIQQQVPQNVANYAGLMQQLGINAMSPQMWAGQNYGNLFSAGAGAQNDNYQGALKAHEIDSNADSAFWGGIGKLGGQIGAAAISASERRLKKNIEKISEDHRGFGIYCFEYIPDDLPKGRRIGFMVDEVEPVCPEAIVMDTAGRKCINYAALV